MEWCVHRLVTGRSFLGSLGWHQFLRASCPVKSLHPIAPTCLLGGTWDFFFSSSGRFPLRLP